MPGETAEVTVDFGGHVGIEWKQIVSDVIWQKEQVLRMLGTTLTTGTYQAFLKSMLEF